MTTFRTARLGTDADVIAPDGSEVRLLVRVDAGSMAHFRLAAGRVSVPARHRTVSEMWYVVEGEGEMWRASGGIEEVVALEPGAAITIPLGTSFQFRAATGAAFAAVGVTMPPWPGDGEVEFVPGPWAPTESSGA